MVVDDVRFWVGVAEQDICFFAFFKFIQASREWVFPSGFERLSVDFSSFSSFKAVYPCWGDKRKEIRKWRERRRTVGQNKQDYRLEYWATRSSIPSLTCTGHSIDCSTLLASLARSAVLTRLLPRSAALIPSLVGQ